MTNVRRRGGGCAVALALVLVATASAAQSTGSGATPDDLNGPGQSHQHRRKPSGDQSHPAAVPEVRITPEPWPRLDPGAVFCRTSEDLQQHLAAIVARLDGTSAVAEPVGCSVIREATAVQVLARNGPARTEVRISNAPAGTGSGGTGWTDAFLPDKRSGP